MANTLKECIHLNKTCETRSPANDLAMRQQRKSTQ